MSSIICPHCGTEYGFILVAKKKDVPDTNYDELQHHFRAAGQAKEFPCRYRCGVTLRWKVPYVKGDHPVNLDGSQHVCVKETT